MIQDLAIATQSQVQKLIPVKVNCFHEDGGGYTAPKNFTCAHKTYHLNHF